MNNFSHVFIFFIFSSVILSAQNHSEFMTLDIDSPDPFVQYEVASSNQKLLHSHNNKSFLTHRLDSTYGYSAPGNLGKTAYIYEKQRYIAVNWDLDFNGQNPVPTNYNALSYKDDLLISQSYNYWDGDMENINEENPLVLRTFLYNENNQIVDVQAQDVIDIVQGVYNSSFYEYNNEGQLSSLSSYRWDYDIDTLKKSSFYRYHHNNKNLLQSVVDYRYQDALGFYVRDSTALLYKKSGELDTLKYYTHCLENEGCTQLESTHAYFHNDDGSIDKIIEYPGWVNNPVETHYYYTHYGSLGADATFYYDSQEQYWGKTRLRILHDSTVLAKNVMKPPYFFSNPYFGGSRSMINNSTYWNNHMVLWEFHFSGDSPVQPEVMLLRAQNFYSEFNPTSTDDSGLLSELSITLFPNPTSQSFRIDADHLDGSFDLSVTDINGQRVLQKSLLKKGQDIDVSSLEVGLYFYTVQKGDKQYVGKFVVER